MFDYKGDCFLMGQVGNFIFHILFPLKIPEIIIFIFYLWQ